MKNYIYYLFALLALNACQQQSEPSEEGGVASISQDAEYAKANEVGGYGAVIEAKETVHDPTSLLRAMEGEELLEGVQLRAEIEEICQKKGCWMTINAPESNIRVTFKDYGFFVPRNVQGKTVLMEGKAYFDTISVDDLRHYAEDEGQTPEQIAQITEPEFTLSFEAVGVLF